MKPLVSINRSGKAGASSLTSEPTGVEILPQGGPTLDYEVFLVAKGLNTFGVGAVISPDDYFSPDKSLDVYALLCARSEPTTISGLTVDVYPIFFIARLAGMSSPFSQPNIEGDVRTLCLDVVQRTGAGDSEAPMQSRVTLNLPVHTSQDVGPNGVIFRPSWDRYISSPDVAVHYESAAYKAEWSMMEADFLKYQVLNKPGDVRFGPYTYANLPLQVSDVLLSTSDIKMQNDWAIWCGQANDGPNEGSVPHMTFSVSLSRPFAAVVPVVSETALPFSLVWLCLLVTSGESPSLAPIAYRPTDKQWGNLSGVNGRLINTGALYNA